MQPIPVLEPSNTDLTDALQQIKDMAARLKRVFDKVEDEAILNGKAIPLVRLLHSVLRTQIQLADKIERRKKDTVDGHVCGKEIVQENGSGSLRVLTPCIPDSFSNGKRSLWMPSTDHFLPNALPCIGPLPAPSSLNSPPQLNRHERRRIEMKDKRKMRTATTPQKNTPGCVYHVPPGLIGG